MVGARRVLGWLALLLPVAGLSGERPVGFARDVRPVLSERCGACHGARRQDGGLRLDLRGRALAGGDSGRAIVPGDPDASELIRRLTADDPKHRMPLGAPPLPVETVRMLRRWIQAGAEWPDAEARAESHRDHWSFRPVRRPPVPRVREPALVRNPVDAFVLAGLERRELTLSPEAEPRTLIRRLYLDLVGLPPEPAEIEAFVREYASDREGGRTSAGAYERLVDRLLASPHFGERWGRHWLDVARYAESDGYENDRIRPDAWRYRDWVVSALNRDLPYDRFTLEQLAGDLLAAGAGEKPLSPGEAASARIAAGLHRNTLWNSAASADKEEFRTFAVKDRVETTGGVWMGLTVGCAQCHSHKYDPLTQREYYQLYAFFNNVDEEDVPVAGGTAPSLRAVRRDNYLHVRGSFLQRGPVVSPGTPEFLPSLKPRGAEADRLDLARWLVDPRHPLTSRVAVNRAWQHLFGRGLVATPENFGLSGARPVQGELLDWLASVYSAPATPADSQPSRLGLGWSLKRLIRLIVGSAVYRQSSEWREDAAEADPENALLARQNRFRVEAEIVRDLSLSAGGLLDRTVGGPSVVPPFPRGLLEQRFTNEALRLPGPGHHRRGIYVHVQRTLPHPSLAAFDGTDGNQACYRRERSITPIQALTLLNDPVYTECAAALGRRLIAAAVDREERIAAGFRLCLGRPPSPEEQAVLVQLVEEQRRLGASEQAVWTGVARTLLNLEEFTTRE